jgi:hypothetical protein
MSSGGFGGFRTLILGGALVAAAAGAQMGRQAQAMTEEEYLRALSAAERKVQRERSVREAPANALSMPFLTRHLGRPYRVGDSWDVAVFLAAGTQARKSGTPAALRNSKGQLGIFHYEVTELRARPAGPPEAVIRVTQVAERGMAAIDPAVKELTLRVNEQSELSEKAYRLDGRAEPVKVSTQGVRTPLTPWELLPLDVPELLTAERSDARAAPSLPPALERVARDRGWAPDLARSTWFEQDDFFGRPVQVLWQQGDPWPAYIRAGGAVAALISRGGR